MLRVRAGVGQSAQRGSEIPGPVSRRFRRSCSGRTRRPRRGSRGAHRAVARRVCSASSCRSFNLTQPLYKSRILNRRPGRGTLRGWENALEKHDRHVSRQIWIKPVRIHAGELPARRRSCENLSWKASSTCVCAPGARFPRQPLLFSPPCPDSARTGHRVLESHWGTADWNIHLVKDLCEEGSLTLSPDRKSVV